MSKNRTNLAKWIPQHYYWLWSVGYGFLSRKGISVMDYLYEFVMGKCQVDEFGLLIFACMFHIRIGVIIANRFWSTTLASSVNDYDIILAFRGHMIFDQTVSYEVVTVDIDIFFL